MNVCLLSTAMLSDEQQRRLAIAGAYCAGGLPQAAPEQKFDNDG
jgi:hypothetical protein